MTSIADILASCLEDIKAGKATAEECLARHEDVRGELEPLLRLGLNVEKLPPVSPSSGFKVRAKAILMEEIRKEQNAAADKRAGFSWPGLVRAGWFRITAIALAFVIVLSGAGSGTVFAASDSLPGETLYPVKTGWEDVRDWLETDPAASAELQVEFAGRRLQELKRLLAVDPSNVSVAISGYEGNLEKAIRQAEDTTTIHALDTVAGKILEHLGLLDGIEDEFDLEAGSDVSLVTDYAIASQVRAIQTIAVENAAAAANLTVKVMEHRMQRAAGSFTGGRGNHGEQALHQFLLYSGLCDEITAAAGENATLDELLDASCRAMQGRFNGIKENVPEQLTQQIENAFQNIQQNQHGKPDSPGMGNGQGQAAGGDGDNQGQDNGYQGNSGQGSGQSGLQQPADNQSGPAGNPDLTQPTGSTAGQNTSGEQTGDVTGNPGQGKSNPAHGQSGPEEKPSDPDETDQIGRS